MTERPERCPGYCDQAKKIEEFDQRAEARRKTLWPAKPKDLDAIPTLEEGLEILRTRLKALEAMRADIEKKIEILEGASTTTA